MFSTLYGTYFSFEMHFKMSSSICFNLDQRKILSSGHGLKSSHCLIQGGSKVGALTALGQDQMYVIGKKLRHQYVTEAGLISGTYDPEEV